MREYEAAYSSGSIPALSRILAPDVQVRANGQGVTFNRNDALESYRLQFADLRKSFAKWKYTIFSNNLKGVGSKSTVASGSYRLTRFAPDGTASVQEGPIELTFSKRNGRAVITVKDEPGR